MINRTQTTPTTIAHIALFDIAVVVVATILIFVRLVIVIDIFQYMYRNLFICFLTKR